VTVHWTLIEADDGVSFLVSRAPGEEGDAWTALDAADIERKDLSFSFFDGAVEEGASYRYRVAVERPGGGEPRVLFETAPVDIPRLPLLLEQNRPNPFNPSTAIRFHLPEAGRVRLDVFDVRGRLVATIVDGRLPAGNHVAEWDGRDATGGACSSGVFFCRLAAGKERRSMKMVLLR